MTAASSAAQTHPVKLKMIICVRRRPELSREAFHKYWLENHAPLASSVRARGLAPTMTGYVQNHTLDVPSAEAFRHQRGMNVEPYDGITEVWLDRIEDLDMGDNLSPELIAAQQMLVEDELKFADLTSSRVFMVEAHDIFTEPGPSEPGFKMIICVHRRPGMSREEFQHYWLEKHAPLASSVRAQGLAPPMRGYVQNHTIDAALLEPFRIDRGMTLEPYDGITEVWIDRMEDMDVGSDLSAEFVAAQKMLIEDEGKFVDFSRSSVFIVQPHRIF